jgi:hypothetical protein
VPNHRLTPIVILIRHVVAARLVENQLRKLLPAASRSWRASLIRTAEAAPCANVPSQPRTVQSARGAAVGLGCPFPPVARILSGTVRPQCPQPRGRSLRRAPVALSAGALSFLMVNHLLIQFVRHVTSGSSSDPDCDLRHLRTLRVRLLWNARKPRVYTGNGHHAQTTLARSRFHGACGAARRRWPS